MRITIDSTTQIVEANGVACRVWEGTTESGVKVTVLIPRIAVKDGEDTSQFEQEMQEQRAPSADVKAFPLRMIL